MTLEQANAWTIGRVLTWSTEFLRERGLTSSPRLDAELLLGHALKLSRIQLYTQFDKPLSGPEREPFKAFLKRRSNGEPVAYITGEREFMGLAFMVGPAVLIPRPDTEVLVEEVLNLSKGHQRPSILDVGTGSGCIAVSLAKLLERAEVTAWEIEDGALLVAAANADRHAVSVAMAKVDALDAANWQGPGRYDVIVSNPPYVAPSESLPASVVNFEPGRALFAPPDGLGFYRAMAKWAPHLLVLDGRVALEVGHTQSEIVAQILADCGWRDIKLRQDYAKVDRVITATRPVEVEA